MTTTKIDSQRVQDLIERGDGPVVWDVDGNQMFDFHNGFGSMVQGHANPAIGKAIAERYPLGTHFAAPTEDAIVVGDELSRRWDLPKWRYTNFGSYHGHHDTVMVSIGVEYDKIGDTDDLASSWNPP